MLHHRPFHRIGIVDQQRPADRGDVAAGLGFESAPAAPVRARA